MSLIFSIIGFIILGFLVRAIISGETNDNSPKVNHSTSSVIFQIIISLIVGFVVWSTIPQRCKQSSDRDYDGRFYNLKFTNPLVIEDFKFIITKLD
jgi:uncharacterized membrane protein